MTVEVRYHVIRDGEEVAVYPTKKEADEYDKMLDIAFELGSFIEKNEKIKLDEETLEELAIYLSGHREEVIRILKAIKPRRQAPKEPAAPAKEMKAKEKKPRAANRKTI